MDKDLLHAITATATLATPILLAILSGIGWLVKRRMDTSKTQQESQTVRIRELKDKLHEDRIETYNQLLEPFFLLFTSDAAFAQDPKYKGKKKDEMAISRMLSVEYRKVGFKLSLVASDTVVRSYNKLMQFFYHSELNKSELDVKASHWIALIGELLLEIRKSMGNESSTLDAWEMIEWFMTDARKMKSTHLNAQKDSSYAPSVVA